jgi:hypothetical protein
MRTLLAVAAVAVALSACGQTATDATTDTAAEMPAPAPAASIVMITESDARARIESAGYTDVTGLVQNADGTWSATATRDGAATQVTISDAGVQVSTAPTP